MATNLRLLAGRNPLRPHVAKQGIAEHAKLPSFPGAQIALDPLASIALFRKRHTIAASRHLTIKGTSRRGTENECFASYTFELGPDIDQGQIILVGYKRDRFHAFSEGPFCKAATGRVASRPPSTGRHAIDEGCLIRSEEESAGGDIAHFPYSPAGYKARSPASISGCSP